MGLIEVIIAVVILAFGLLAVAGITLSVASQTRRAAVRTDQAFAAQQLLEATERDGYGAMTVGTRDTVVRVGPHDYPVRRTVTQVSPDVRQLQVVIQGVGGLSADTFVTRVHRPR